MNERRGDEPGDRGGPFGALVAAACRDPGAAGGLAAAYAALPPEGRQRMVEAIVTDARGEGVPPAVALVPLLAVEDDATVARTISEAIVAEEGIGLAHGARMRARMADGPGGGAVIVTRPLWSGFAERIAVTWDAQGRARAEHRPLIRFDADAPLPPSIPDGVALERCPAAVALDRAAEVLWRHRRDHGELPADAAALLRLL